jgi:hypothetical protein
MTSGQGKSILEQCKNLDYRWMERLKLGQWAVRDLSNDKLNCPHSSQIGCSSLLFIWKRTTHGLETIILNGWELEKTLAWLVSLAVITGPGCKFPTHCRLPLLSCMHGGEKIVYQWLRGLVIEAEISSSLVQALKKQLTMCIFGDSPQSCTNWCTVGWITQYSIQKVQELWLSPMQLWKC